MESARACMGRGDHDLAECRSAAAFGSAEAASVEPTVEPCLATHDAPQQARNRPSAIVQFHKRLHWTRECKKCLLRRLSMLGIWTILVAAIDVGILYQHGGRSCL